MNEAPETLKPEQMPAFPLHNGDVWGGMTLRDFFAAYALQGIIAANMACLLIPEQSKNRIWLDCCCIPTRRRNAQDSRKITPIASCHEA